MGYIVHRGEDHPVPFDVVDGRGVGLWWEPPMRNVRRRRSPVRFGVLHHQGGEGQALAVWRVLRGRRLSVHFQIDQHGTVTQYADLDVATFHAGAANDSSWGVEIANAAKPPGHAKHPRETYTDTVHGREREMLRFYPAQVGAAYDLCRAVQGILGLPMTLPMDGEGRVRRDVLSGDELAEWHGLVGHYHLTERKWDPVPHLLDDIAARACVAP